jgi:hypothetical protein
MRDQFRSGLATKEAHCKLQENSGCPGIFLGLGNGGSWVVNLCDH